jgi:hypothetical protein
VSSVANENTNVLRRRLLVLAPLALFLALALLFVFRLYSGDPYAATGADENGRAAIEWGVYGVPETFVVGKDARIAYKLVGPITAENIEALLKPQIEKALAANPS